MEIFDVNTPYNTLPLLPPSREVETHTVLKECLSATRTLAELKGLGGLLPDQSILINSIPLQEAKLSSEIENIVTTQDELFQANMFNEASLSAGMDFDNAKIDPASKEVLRYRSALRYGFDELKKHDRPFNMRLIRDICSMLRGKSVEFRPYGKNVALANTNTNERKYTPPDGGDIVFDKLDNLEKYMLDYKGHDPLIRMAIMHYQFEAIHPFDDGNGRTGRIMNILFLINEGLLDLPVLYLSKFLIENKNEYYRLLRSVTESGNWEDWIIFMLKGITSTAQLTANRVRQISDLFNETCETVKTKAPKIYSKDLVEAIFRQVYCKVIFLVRAKIARQQTASLYLKELARIGVLTELKMGRDKIFINSRLLEILR